MAWIAAALAVLSAGCATPMPRDPVPERLVEKAEVYGMPEIRFWGDEKSAALDRSLKLRVSQSVATRLPSVRAEPVFDVKYLALSGGAGDGAYGAGLLCGWTTAGTRPEFEIVTGVSTGALMAPFAFLGPAYDRQLRELYTTMSTQQIMTAQILPGLLGGVALADSAPLADHIRRYVDRAVLAAIGAQHKKGRRLFVATTNLDAQRPVIWDMGAIASIGTPQADDLFRSVLLASASIPGGLPPVHIKVTAGGKHYEEMHVDGGPTNQVFFLPMQVLLANYSKGHIKTPIRRHLFVIRNTKVAPEFEAVKNSTLKIAERSLVTLTKSQGVGDLYRLYIEAKANNMSFQVAAIPASFRLVSKEPFDPAYMRKLFDVGYEQGRMGSAWSAAPPGLLSPSR